LKKDCGKDHWVLKSVKITLAKLSWINSGLFDPPASKKFFTLKNCQFSCTFSW